MITDSCNLALGNRLSCEMPQLAGKECEKLGCCYDSWLQECYKPEVPCSKISETVMMNGVCNVTHTSNVTFCLLSLESYFFPSSKLHVFMFLKYLVSFRLR